MIDDREAFAARLALLLKRQPDVFGASSHMFELNERLPDLILSKFERKHSISLPDGYRWFLSRIGNGGAGPFHGVFALGEVDDGHDTITWTEGDGFVGCLRELFPHTTAWNDLSGRPDEIDSESTEYEAAFDAFEQRYFDPRNVNGAIPICHLGCAIRIWLVISGPERGRVWLDKRTDYQGLTPLLDADGKGLCFLAWYRAWIEESLRQPGTA
jgi:hypothetical protein